MRCVSAIFLRIVRVYELPERPKGDKNTNDRVVWLRVRINQAANIVDHAALDCRLLEWQSHQR